MKDVWGNDGEAAPDGMQRDAVNPHSLRHTQPADDSRQFRQSDTVRGETGRAHLIWSGAQASGICTFSIPGGLRGHASPYISEMLIKLICTQGGSIS